MIEACLYNDPYQVYRDLRETGPIHRDTEFYGGAWLLPNYADVLNVLRDTRFSVQRAGRWVNSTGPNAREELRQFKRIFSRSLLFLDGAHHTRLRKVMNAGFKPSALARLAPRIQNIVDQLLGRLGTRTLATSTPEWGSNPVYRGLTTLPVNTGETMRPLAVDQNALANTKLQRPIVSSAVAIARIEA